MRRLRQLVVGVEVMGPHGGIACPDMVGQDEVDWRRLSALFAAALEGQAHGVGVRHVALQGVEDGRLKFARAVMLEQPDQGGGDGAEIVAALGGADEQGLARRRCLGRQASVARWRRAARLWSTRAWRWAGSSICSPLP